MNIADMSRFNGHEMFHLNLEQKCVKVQQLLQHARRRHRRKKFSKKISQMFVAICDKNTVESTLINAQTSLTA